MKSKFSSQVVPTPFFFLPQHIQSSDLSCSWDLCCSHGVKGSVLGGGWNLPPIAPEMLPIPLHHSGNSFPFLKTAIIARIFVTLPKRCPYKYIFLHFLAIFFLNGHTYGIWKFPWSCSCRPMPQPWHHRIPALSTTYTTAHSNARSLTH